MVRQWWTKQYASSVVNHYEVLGVDPGATTTEIKAAYLAAARRHHPDFHVGSSDAVRARHARQMVQINQAWGVLGDDPRRESYDQALRSRRSSHGPHWSTPRTERSRYRVEPPPGKGWTPRADDDGWIRDFQGWRAETDEPAPDAPPAGPVHGVLALAPMALFLVALVVGVLGVATDARTLLAVAFVALLLSAGSFALSPMIQMVWDRRRRR